MNIVSDLKNILRNAETRNREYLDNITPKTKARIVGSPRRNLFVALHNDNKNIQPEAKGYFKLKPREIAALEAIAFEFVLKDLEAGETRETWVDYRCDTDN